MAFPCGEYIGYATIFLSSGQEATMNIQHERILFRVADILISLTAVFLLLDAMFGFTRHPAAGSAPSQLVTQDANSAHLAISCLGGFSNERTVHGKTQIAAHGTPFNAYQLTFSNSGNSVITVHGVTVTLADHENHVFARQHVTHLGKRAGLTLDPGQPRQIVETAGIRHPVATCEVLTWQP